MGTEKREHASRSRDAIASMEHQMNTKQAQWLFAGILLAACSIACGFTVVNAESPKKEAPNGRLIEPVKGDPSGWVADRVSRGKSIYLSANYLFQVTKLNAQLTQMEFEQENLYPALIKLMDGMKDMGVKGEALVFVEMTRKLLDPNVACDPEIAGQMEERMAGFERDPGNVPRGHYTRTEELTRYFRAVRFLTGATFDVDVNKRWFAQKLYLLFPLDAGLELIKGLSNPQQRPLLDELTRIDAFYGKLVGPSDLPTFHDLIDSGSELNANAISNYAHEKQLPKINKEMGVGVQFFGERFAYHQAVIDALAEKLRKDEPDLTRQQVLQVMQFANILSGSKATGNKGILSYQGKPSGPHPSYYELLLAALTKIPGAKTSTYAKNSVAAGLTALAEQTILVTKQTTVVPKSAGPMASEKKPADLYVQPGIGQFLELLGQAHKELSTACEAPYPQEAYKELIKASQRAKPVKSTSPEGAEILTFVATLPLNPVVTADIFQFKSRSDKGFLQWAIGPFEVEYPLPGKAKAIGLEMVFFQGWHDTARKGADDPMTNEAWREVFQQGQYKQFEPLLIKVP